MNEGIFLRGRDRDFTLPEVLDILDDMDQAAAGQDWETVCRLGKALPLDPETARDIRRSAGKEGLLEMGFDLTEANLAFGRGWLDD